MRVLMTADTLGGIWTYALELTRELGRYDTEVCLATMGPIPNLEQRIEASAIPNLTLFKSSFRLEWMVDPWDDVLRAGEWLLSLESRLKPDIIHLNGYAHAVLPWLCPTVVVGHSCMRSWWRAVFGENCGREWDRYTKAVALGLAAAGLVVAPTNAMLAALQSHYGPVPGEIIYNGRNPSRFAPKIKEPFIFAAGRLWDQAKNISALSAVAGKTAWPIYAAGQDHYPGTVSPSVSPEGIRMLGRLSSRRMNDWLSRAAIFAAPARYEPFGISILEAGLSGCALILGDIPSLREIWSDAAIFVHADDEKTLGSVIEELTRDRVFRAALACRARERANQFTAARMGARYMESYHRLVASPSGAIAFQHSNIH